MGCKQATLWIVAVRVWFEFGSRCNFVFAKMSKYDVSAKRARDAHLRNSRSGDGRVRELGFLAAALARVMSVAGPIPALASVSVLQSAAVGGSVVGVVGLL